MQPVFSLHNSLLKDHNILQNHTIGVIGLGYVGLPLAIAFAGKYQVTGFDIDPLRISELQQGIDHTGEATKTEILDLFVGKSDGGIDGLYLTSNPAELSDCNVYIVTVPTPVDSHNRPDLTLLQAATETVAACIRKGDIVIYESTVFPGCTEEIAVPILERISGLVFNTDFFCGYSPERINPGDKKRRLADIQKITSGSTAETAEKVDVLYKSIISAGTYPAPSIKVAEAAKVIENTQRDINIAFVNELARIFHLLSIDTGEVLKAAATKWNFLPFQPGLVGGHCIGIDPYYLAYRSEAAGYTPDIILAARSINDGMGEYVATRLLQLMAKKGIATKGAEVLIMGIAFKENFSDVRNSRVVDIIKVLGEYQMEISIYDPLVSTPAIQKEYGFVLLTDLSEEKKFDAIIVAVNHDIFADFDYDNRLKESHVLFDVKGGVRNRAVDGRL